MKVGGTETMLVDIANTQSRLGHKVTILIVNDIVCQELLDKIDPSVEVIRMNRKEGDKPLLMMLRLNAMIMRMRPDIIHAHHHKFCRLVQVRKKRLLFTVHTVNTPMVYSAHSRMVAITDTVREDITGRVPDARVRTIFNGIRTADIACRGKRPLGERLRLVQVANILPHIKGQDIAIEALGILKSRGIENVEFDFIGAGDTSALMSRAEELGVAERVHFLGLRDRDYIYSHLCDYDAMCHPSRYEGFGLTVAEGMAAGLPLILTHGDGPWEIADKGALCISMQNGDAASCADAIATLMHNYDAALATAEKARSAVRQYDISRTVDQYIDYYREMVGDK